MNEKEKAEIYVELAKVQWARFDKRRDIEWKVTIGLWTAVILFTGFMAGKIQTGWIHLAFYGVFWLVYSVIWTAGRWLANETDKRYALVYMNRAELLLGHTTEQKEFKLPHRLGFLCNWAEMSQIGGAALVMLLSWFVLYTWPAVQAAPTR